MIEFELDLNPDVNVLEELVKMDSEGVSFYFVYANEDNRYDAFKSFNDKYGITPYVTADNGDNVIIRYKDIDYLLDVFNDGDDGYVVEATYQEKDDPYEFVEDEELLKFF